MSQNNEWPSQAAPMREPCFSTYPRILECDHWGRPSKYWLTPLVEMRINSQRKAVSSVWPLSLYPLCTCHVSGSDLNPGREGINAKKTHSLPLTKQSFTRDTDSFISGPYMCIARPTHAWVPTAHQNNSYYSSYNGPNLSSYSCLEFPEDCKDFCKGLLWLHDLTQHLGMCCLS